MFDISEPDDQLPTAPGKPNQLHQLQSCQPKRENTQPSCGHHCQTGPLGWPRRPGGRTAKDEEYAARRCPKPLSCLSGLEDAALADMGGASAASVDNRSLDSTRTQCSSDLPPSPPCPPCCRTPCSRELSKDCFGLFFFCALEKKDY